MEKGFNVALLTLYFCAIHFLNLTVVGTIGHHLELEKLKLLNFSSRAHT